MTWFSWIEYGKRMACYQRLWLPSPWLFLLLSLAVLCKPDACCEVLYGKAHMTKNWRKPSVNSLWRTEASVQKPLRNRILPINNHVSELGSRSFPLGSWDDCSPARDPEPRIQLSCFCILGPQKLWENKCCFYMPLRFGVTCYITVDN